MDGLAELRRVPLKPARALDVGETCIPRAISPVAVPRLRSLQYSSLGNPHGQRSLVATVPGVTKSQTRLKD